MAETEQIELIRTCLKQGEFDQRSRQVHRLRLDLRGESANIAAGVIRTGQIMDGQPEIRIVELLLADLTVGFGEYRRTGRGIQQRPPDRSLEQVRLDGTVDPSQ